MEPEQQNLATSHMQCSGYSNAGAWSNHRDPPNNLVPVTEGEAGSPPRLAALARAEHLHTTDPAETPRPGTFLVTGALAD